MTLRNSYATLADFRNYATDRGGNAPVANAVDDAVIERLLEMSSRYLDSKTARAFYPRIETRNYSIPSGYGRELHFDTDVLEIITLTNGDDTSIASTEYYMQPRNDSPKHALYMRELSTVSWELDSNGEYEGVLDVRSINGFHDRYSDAWVSAGTLGAAITDTTTLAYTMTAGHTLLAGQITRIDNEIGIVNSVSANTITPAKRGDNGSTAATHLNGVTVYVWQPMEEVRNATIEITNNAYHRRFGQSIRSEETITAAGIVLTPREIPHMAKEFIKVYERRVR
jgi:hypothetical protein